MYCVQIQIIPSCFYIWLKKIGNRRTSKWRIFIIIISLLELLSLLLDEGSSVYTKASK